MTVEFDATPGTTNAYPSPVNRKIQLFLPILVFGLLAPSAFAIPKYLYPDTKFCQFFLTAQHVQLADLVEMDVVESEGKYLNAPREYRDPAEFATAKILAERLRQPLALIPRLTKTVNIPAVDGILFNGLGEPVANFSIKTFMPSSGNGRNLNRKLEAVLEQAVKSVENHYSVTRWREILRKFMNAPSVTDADCDQECRTYTKIFGLSDHNVRPVKIVIDYTKDSTAIFRLTGKFEPGQTPRQFLTLNARDDEAIDVTEIMDEIRKHPVIDEYIFLGMHHLLRISATSYQMTEFCDNLGHSHGH